MSKELEYIPPNHVLKGGKKAARVKKGKEEEIELAKEGKREDRKQKQGRVISLQRDLAP